MAVMAQPWKHPQNGIYYFRREVPQDIRSIIGKREWKVSLKSKDLAQARPRFAAESLNCEEMFAAARDQLKGRPRVLSSDAPKLADRWAKEVMRQWDADPDAIAEFLATVGTPGESMHRVPAYDVLDTDSPKVVEATVTPYIQSTLKSEGLPMPSPGEPSRDALRICFLHRWHDLCTMAHDRYLGDWRTSLNLTEAEKPLAKEAKPEEVRKLPLLSEALKSWAKQKAALDPGSDKTIGTFETTVDRFIELFGDLSLDQIKRQQVGAFSDLLQKVPTQGAGLRKMNVRGAIAYGEAEGLPTASLATVKNQLRHLEAILNHARTLHEELGENPVTASGIINRLTQSMKRRPSRLADEKHYSRRDLKAIFTSLLYTTGWTPPRADYGEAMYWLPLIMLYTGARREEIAKLYASDVIKDPDYGIWHFRVRAIDDETVKTANSQRRVPIHQDLIDLGFLSYLDSLSAGSRMFDKLEPSKDGFGHAVGKAWGNYLRDVVKLDTQASPSHGFRHTFKTLCREVGIPKEVGDWITGHAAADVSDTYGANPLVRMSEELKKFPSIARETGLLPRKQSGLT